MQNITDNDVNSFGSAVCFIPAACPIGDMAGHPDMIAAALTQAFEDGAASVNLDVEVALAFEAGQDDCNTCSMFVH